MKNQRITLNLILILLILISIGCSKRVLTQKTIEEIVKDSLVVESVRDTSELIVSRDTIAFDSTLQKLVLEEIETIKLQNRLDSLVALAGMEGILNRSLIDSLSYELELKRKSNDILKSEIRKGAYTSTFMVDTTILILSKDSISLEIPVIDSIVWDEGKIYNFKRIDGSQFNWEYVKSITTIQPEIIKRPWRYTWFWVMVGIIVFLVLLIFVVLKGKS